MEYHTKSEALESNVWSTVTHAHNPSYTGGRDQEDCGLRPAWAKIFTRPPSQPMARHDGIYMSSQATWGNTNNKITIQVRLDIKHNPHLTNNQSKRVGRMAEVVMCLSRKCKTLHSASSTSKKRKKEKEKRKERKQCTEQYYPNLT
jgi:hypothetical protein